jgi:hypothetical protein
MAARGQSTAQQRMLPLQARRVRQRCTGGGSVRRQRRSGASAEGLRASLGRSRSRSRRAQRLHARRARGVISAFTQLARPASR